MPRPRFRRMDASDLLSGLSSMSIRDSTDRTGYSARPGSDRWPGSGGGGGAAAERHNVARLPQLDYFVRKLDQAFSEDGPSAKWDLPYAKAGQAGDLPDDFARLDAYLDAMQAAAALEFQASAKQALEQAERERRHTGLDGFHTFAPQKGGTAGGRSGTSGTWVFAGTAGDLDFEQDSWGRHLVEVEETRSFHVAALAKQDEETGEQVLVLLPAVEREGQSLCRMRTLGYIGPFLAQFDAAQELRYEDRLGRVPSATRALLSAVAEPSDWRTWARLGGTLRTASAAGMHTDIVPLNGSQQRAVLGLRGGLDVIHGPPGTGKSTTIYHVIASRVEQDAQVLVTCTRNQAIDSVADKVALLPGGVLMFGNAKRLGERAAQHTLEARVESHEAVAAWKGWLEELKELECSLLQGQLAFGGHSAMERRLAAVLRGMVDKARTAPFELKDSVERLQDRLDHVMQKENSHSCELERVVAAAVSLAANEALPKLRAHVKRQLLEATRAFVCTIDATARMAAELQELEVRLRLDTVLVDEAGCVLESAVPLLLRLHPANLVLIGDHKQLQAFSALVDPPRNHCRSLMERCVDAGMLAAMLSEQYRMHPAICTAISAAFYDGKLRSAPGTAARRPCSPACRLVNVNGREEQHTGAGFSNREEAGRAVAEVEAAAATLATKRPARGTASPGERLRAAGWEVAVLSADACQGSEADIVVMSTVRNTTAAKTSGAPLSRFFHDRRRINVALSRARHLCVVVGSGATLRQAATREPFWRTLMDHYG